MLTLMQLACISEGQRFSKYPPSPQHNVNVHGDECYFRVGPVSNSWPINVQVRSNRKLTTCQWDLFVKPVRERFNFTTDFRLFIRQRMLLAIGLRMYWLVSHFAMTGKLKCYINHCWKIYWMVTLDTFGQRTAFELWFWKQTGTLKHW